MSQTGAVAITDNSAKKRRNAGELLLDTFGLTPDSMSTVERRTAISGYDLKYRIEAMVSGISKKRIKHIYKGDGAATAPGMMILPRIVATSLFPIRHVRILLGYTAHEISHQLKTDFKLLDKLVNDQSLEKRRKQQIKQFWNAIEDYRIEKLVKKDYPGFHVYIDDTRDFSAKRFCERVEAGLFTQKELSNPYRIGAVALTWIGADLNKYQTTAPLLALNQLDPGLTAWLRSWADDMAKVETCQQALDLAVAILDELDKLRALSGEEEGEGEEENSNPNGETRKQQQKNNKSPDNSKDEASGQDDQDVQSDDDAGGGADNQSDDDGQSQKDADSNGDQDGDGEVKPSSGGGDGTESGKEEAKSKEGGSGDPRPQLKVEDGDEQSEAEEADLEIDELSKAINSMQGEEATNAKISNEDSIAGMGARKDDVRMQNIERGRDAYAELRTSVGAPAARAAGILRRLLQATSKRTWIGGMEDGHLDFSRVVGMTRGDQNVYRQQNVRTSVNTAVCLLLDNSYSMKGHPLLMCQKTAVVVDMAIQGTKTNVEITGFTGDKSNPKLYRYRAFGQKGQAASASLGNMDKVDLGGTPVSTPLMEAWRRLSQQKEPRRIMIVVSDGGADYNDVKASRQAHDFIVSQGCTVLGIAIGAETEMKNWCTNVQAVNDINDLPIALTNLVRKALT